MKRAMIIGAVLAVAGMTGVGLLYGRDYLDGMRFETAMSAIGKADEANAGRWPQPQETCFFCHGPRGQSLNSWYPALSGQPQAGTTALATYSDQFYAGKAAAVTRKAGKGTVTYIGVDTLSGELVCSPRIAALHHR